MKSLIEDEINHIQFRENPNGGLPIMASSKKPSADHIEAPDYDDSQNLVIHRTTNSSL